MLGKTVLIQGKGWQRVELTKEETEKSLAELMKFNLHELSKIIIATKESNVMAISQQDMIRLLFDKQALSAFTILQTKLDEKIENLKKENRND
jgi:hypothetical protein